MSGTALVTIGENQWSVEVATNYYELTNGLSGRESIAAGTGMLFILPTSQTITVQTNEMLFPIDIIFIKDNLVLDIASNISPGLLVEEATPIDMFLEINSGEAALVEVGDAVDVELLLSIQTPGFDISSIIAFAIPLAILGFVFGMLPYGSSGKELSSGHHSSLEGKPPGLQPMTPAQRKELITMYGEDVVKQAEIDASGKGYGAIAIKCEEISTIREQEYSEWKRKFREGYGQYRVGVSEEQVRQEIQSMPKWIRVRWMKEKMLGEGHSIHGEPRRRLVEKYGSWAVGRAEAVCAEDDIAAVEREAKRLSEVYKSRYGEDGMEYVTIISPGQTVFHIDDVVSMVALEKENKRVKALGGNEATWE